MYLIKNEINIYIIMYVCSLMVVLGEFFLDLLPVPIYIIYSMPFNQSNFPKISFKQTAREKSKTLKQ